MTVDKNATRQHITMIVLKSLVYLKPFLTHKIGSEWLNYKNNADRLQLQLARDLSFGRYHFTSLYLLLTCGSFSYNN